MRNYKFTIAQLLALKRTLLFAFSPPQQATTNSIPSLLAAFNQLSSKINNIDQLLSQYSSVNTGYAATKKQARLNLAYSAYVVMKAAYAFSINSGDEILAAKMKISLSRLTRRPFLILSAEMAASISAVQPILNNLTTYNPNIFADFAHWQSMLAAFNQVLNLPQSAIKARKKTGQNIKTAMKDAMNLSRTTISSIVASMSINNLDYHNGYFTQLQIINPAHRHSALQATIVNELGQPLGPGISVTVDEATKITDANTNPPETRILKPKSAYTDIDGAATVKTFEPGIRTVTVSGQNIITKTFGPFQFSPGRPITQTFTCQPTFNNIPSSASNKPAPSIKSSSQ